MKSNRMLVWFKTPEIKKMNIQYFLFFVKSFLLRFSDMILEKWNVTEEIFH